MSGKEDNEAEDVFENPAGGADAKALLAAEKGANTLANRIKHTDPKKYHLSRSHDSAGDMACERLLRSSDMTTSLYFIDRREIMPGGGLGYHFHNRCEEMFIIFDGEAQFAIDSRTSVIIGVAGAPCVMGHSNAIYNSSSKPIQFHNINVSAVKGRYDAFNIEGYLGGGGIDRYRRALHPEIFHANWSYVDYLLLPAVPLKDIIATSAWRRFNTAWTAGVRLNNETAGIDDGDAVPVRLG